MADDESDVSGERGLSIARARAVVAGLERRATKSNADVEGLLTDAAGLRLMLEAERLRAQRQRRAALQPAPSRQTRDAADRLERREELLGGELERLQRVIKGLRALLDQRGAEGRR